LKQELASGLTLLLSSPLVEMGLCSCSWSHWGWSRRFFCNGLRLRFFGGNRFWGCNNSDCCLFLFKLTSAGSTVCIEAKNPPLGSSNNRNRRLCWFLSFSFLPGMIRVAGVSMMAFAVAVDANDVDANY